MACFGNFLRKRKQAGNFSLSEQIGNVNFPARVKVTSSHLSLAKYSITVDSLLDIYSSKSVQIAILKDTVHSRQYLLPLSSTVKISPFYNPEKNVAKADAGYCYQSIQQLYDANPPPSAVFVTNGFLHEEPQSSMDSNDIYVIKEFTAVDGQRVLICEDTVSSELKVFPTYLKCDLTTDPMKLLLAPTTFFAHPNLFASEVVVSGVDHNSEWKIFLTVSELSSIYSYSAVVSNPPENKKPFVELHANVSIEVALVDLTDSETNLLKIKSFFQERDDISKNIIINEEIFHWNEIQKMFLRSNKIDEKRKSTTPLQKRSHPTTTLTQISVPLPPSLKQHPSSSSLPLPRRLSLFDTMNDDNDDNGDDGDDNDDEGNTYDYIPAWSMENTETIIEKHQRRATLYEGQLTSQFDPTTELTSQFDPTTELTSQFDPTTELTSQFDPTTELTSQFDPTTELASSVLEENRETLKDYTPEDVADILKIMGLEQYQETFIAEKISGSLLMELDDEILSNELSMVRKLDRIKLLVIIEGKRPVVDIVKQLNAAKN